MLLLVAMAHQEGFYSVKINPQNRPKRNNNPLDLTYCSETIHAGANHGDPRFSVFPTVAIGWLAAKAWLSVPAKFDDNGELVAGYLGATISQVIYRFAPASENNTQAYIDYVCSQTGLLPDTILTLDMLTIPTSV